MIHVTFKQVLKGKNTYPLFVPLLPIDWNATVMAGAEATILDHEMKAVSCILDTLEIITALSLALDFISGTEQLLLSLCHYFFSVTLRQTKL